MKLVYKIILTLLVPLTLTIGIWGWFSFRTMSKKIHADTDLILRDYSNNIIMRLLSGKELPERFNGAYNTYYIQYISPEEAAESPAVEYGETEAYLKSQEDFASSRTRSQIFQDKDGNFRKITVSLPTFEQEVLVEHVFWWTLMLFITLLASVILIGLISLRYNMKPLYRLLEWIDRYEPGASATKVPSDTDIVEFRKLASVVEQAVTRFETEYEERKIFIGNASHELQTPLAVCSNRIEMMLDRPDMTEELLQANQGFKTLPNYTEPLIGNAQLREELSTASGQKKARILKRLEVVEAFNLSNVMLICSFKHPLVPRHVKRVYITVFMSLKLC